MTPSHRKEALVWAAVIVLAAVMVAGVWKTTSALSALGGSSDENAQVTTTAPQSDEPAVPGGNVLAAAQRTVLNNAAQQTLRQLATSATLDGTGLRDIDPAGSLVENTSGDATVTATVSPGYATDGQITFTAADGTSVCLTVGESAADSTITDGAC